MNRATLGAMSTSILWMLSSTALAQVTFDQDGKWETSFDCPEWEQVQDWGNLVCDGLTVAGAWTCSDDAGKHGGQITVDARNPLSKGARGFRHWQGDGSNNNSGGLGLRFPSPQPEFWIRWYHRYELGFQWSEQYGGMPHYDKLFYINTEKPHNAIFPSHPSGDRWRIATQAPSGAAASEPGIGWQYTMGGNQSDGRFHVHEAHVKMDTDGTDGVARLWIDGELIVESLEMNYSGGTDSEEDQIARNGWLTMLIGSNQNEPDNGRCMYADYDDITIYNQPPPNVDLHGNPFIGPLDWGGSGGSGGEAGFGGDGGSGAAAGPGDTGTAGMAGQGAQGGDSGAAGDVGGSPGTPDAGGGSQAEAPTGKDGEGCGCKAARRASPSPLAWALILAIGWTFRRQFTGTADDGSRHETKI